jgi:hypothetical protein
MSSLSPSPTPVLTVIHPDREHAVAEAMAREPNVLPFEALVLTFTLFLSVALHLILLSPRP